MKNKTPRKEMQVCPYCDKTFSTIINPSPDAEALAEALESLIAHEIEHHVISPVDESVAVIAAYRARFPKAEVTP